MAAPEIPDPDFAVSCRCDQRQGRGSHLARAADQVPAGRDLLFPKLCRDASDKVRDYRCGGRSYDGHDGTDIRIRNLEIQRQGVEVLAAASGRVIGGRNDMEDVSVETVGKAAIAGKECGNGVVLEHEGGWRTQYCHMAKGSVRVKIGDQMTAGQPIGLVGLSGDTEFFHLHFTVRHREKTVDPFAYSAAENSCGGGRSIWAASLAEQTQYRPGEIIDYGFAGIAPTMELMESGESASIPSRRARMRSSLMSGPSACRPATSKCS
jgi:murein DD-endopeptidase MepM/ murein hydrolase activator NlpD